MGELDKLTVQIDTLSKYANALKAIIVFSFLAGIWITTLQLKVLELEEQTTSSQNSEAIADEKFQEWKEKVSEFITVSVEKNKNFEISINEIKSSLTEIRNEVKHR